MSALKFLDTSYILKLCKLFFNLVKDVVISPDYDSHA